MKEEKEDGSAVARENYSSRSAAAVLMMVFQFAKDNTAIHRQGRGESANYVISHDILQGWDCLILH